MTPYSEKRFDFTMHSYPALFPESNAGAPVGTSRTGAAGYAGDDPEVPPRRTEVDRNRPERQTRPAPSLSGTLSERIL
jgi:hypothetical protein